MNARITVTCCLLLCACATSPSQVEPPDDPVVDPPGGSVIGPQAPLRLRFAESMSTESLRLSGTLGAAAVPTWSQTVVPGDTLSLQPAAQSGWTAGEGALLIDVVSTRGAPLRPLSLSYVVDGTVPSASAQPPGGTHLRPTDSIVIRFSKTMQPPSLSLGGTLGTLAQTAWSQTAVESDTLTLTPLSRWPEGAAQTLEVDAVDLVGTALPRLEVAYAIDGTGPGVQAAPGSGEAVQPTRVIALSFDEAMAPAGVLLGGSMGAMATASWSSSTELRINPAPAWSEGGGTLEVTAEDLAGNQVVTSLSYLVDGTSPATVTVSPSDGLLTDPRAEVILRFNEAMDPASLSLGAGAPNGLGPQWSSTSVSNDTLRIPAPGSGWGDGDTLRIEARDPAGNPAPVQAFAARISLIPGAPRIAVPLQAVRVANDDGSRRCRITPEQVALWVAEANRIFAQANVRLVFDPARDFSDEQSTLLNQMTGVSDPQWAEEVAAGNAVAARNPDKLTVFFRWGPGASPTGGGFSWTNYDFAVMPGFNDTSVCGHQNIQLFAHELGHHLGLAHTFAKIYSDVSQIAGDYAGDPAVFDGDGLWDTPPDPFVSTSAVQCDRDLFSVPVDGAAQLIPRDNIMSYYDSGQMGLSRLQAMKIRQGALVRIGGDIRQILPGTFLPPVEGETVAGTATATGGSVGAQTNMRSFLGRWTGDAQLFWSGAADATLSVALEVPSSGIYRLWATFTAAPDFGIHQVYVNGAQAGETVNLYAPSVGHLPPVDLGWHALDRGVPVLVKIVVQGRDTRSSGYALGLDYLLIEPR